MSQNSTKPVKGMRDFLPDEARRRRLAFNIIETTFQNYGFDPLDTPAMERLSSLLGKYGDEGDQLLFKVLKRGSKLESAIRNTTSDNELADAGLRYDLTVPLARVYAEYFNEFPRIFKRYQIAPVWRADRPQKGRFREFIQCDVDVVGSDSIIAEVEVISALSDILNQLDFRNFTIHINHRDLLFAMIAAADIPDKDAVAIITIIDKFDKVGVDGVRKELLESGINEAMTDRLLQILTSCTVGTENNEAMLAYLESQLATGGGESVATKALSTIRHILQLVTETPARNHLAVDPFLARGLSYYTGPIFEIRSNDFSGSVGGGGRYDKLIGMFRNQDVPAVGFSLGIERILMLLEQREGGDLAEPAADVLVTVWSEEFANRSVRLASELRAAGIRTDVYCGIDKYGKQFAYADERNIRYTVIIAPDEVESGVVQVKDMSSSKQTEVERAKVCKWLSEALR